jgi:hypothetical protein
VAAHGQVDMRPTAPSVAEVLRLGLVEGVSVRRIARELRMSRRTVQRILGRFSVPKAPRCSFPDTEEQPRAVRLDNGPVTRSPSVPT